MNKFTALGLTILLFACNNNPIDEKNDATGDISFFPTASFFAGQVKIVDSLQLPVLKYVTKDGHTDTSQITTSAMRLLATDFLQTDLTSPEFRKLYKEQSFADQSISSVTLTYSTTHKELPIQRMDVLINPNPVLNDKVRSIYIEKLEQHADTSYFKKMYWKTDKHFFIITSASVNNEPATTTQVRVQWDQ